MMIKVPSAIQQVRKQVRKTVQRASSTAINTANNVQSALLATTTSNVNRTALLQAVRYAHDQWRLQARFQNIQIMAASATGGPGCLQGPDLDPLICNAPTVIAQLGAMRDLRDAVAEGVADCFGEWQQQVTVPGLPWYPSFVAFPGPMAPPMPNVPMPLIALASSGIGQIISTTALKQAMWNALPAALKTQDVGNFMTDIATRLVLHFSRWLSMQQVTQVMGRGPVPSFAPPYVPVGPVVGGDIISTPGHLATGTLPLIV